MQLAWHSAKASEASVEPSPWSHLAAHSLVSTTWEAFGRALPRHAAWQVTSPAVQANAQLTGGVRPLGMGIAEVGALVTDTSWGRANAPMANRSTVENFIVVIVYGRLVRDGKRRCGIR
jgi:hypothetical protein